MRRGRLEQIDLLGQLPTRGEILGSPGGRPSAPQQVQSADQQQGQQPDVHGGNEQA